MAFKQEAGIYQTTSPGYPGGPPAGAYTGGPPAGAYTGGPPAGAMPGQAPAGAVSSQGGYPGGYPATPAAPPPTGAYTPAAAPPPQSNQPPGVPPAGTYSQGSIMPVIPGPPRAPPAGSVLPAGAPGGTAGGHGQFQGEMPNADVRDDPNAKGPPAAGPPTHKMDAVTGYENVGFSSAVLPPPSYDDAIEGQPPERGEVSNIPVITEEQAREALLQYVAEHCCYGKGAATQLVLLDLKSSSAFHYTLETYGESRNTCWDYIPFTGQQIDGPFNGPAPGPWDIQANAPGPFQNGKMDVEVPHTASVKPCHECLALGRVRCFRCHGRGRLFCHTCNGTGRENYFEDGQNRSRYCTWCDGSGRRRCYTCDGFGQITCKTCAGNGNLKCYIKLTIMWQNHLNDHIVERTALPDELIRGVTGQIAFEEVLPRVWPINHFPDAEINNASKSLISKHSAQYSNERILSQRHRVRIIPVTQALYKWKDNNGNFFVYGFEHKVHAPDYPQTCCWGCEIL